MRCSPSTHPLAGASGVVVDHQVHPLADGESRCVLALLVEFAADRLHRLGERRRGRRAGTEEGVAQPHRAGQRLGGGAADPERRMRPLHRLGLDRQAVDVAESAVERHLRLVGPRRLHQLEALGEIADERRLLHAERRERPEVAAVADADVQPAVAEPVDRGDGRRQLQRVMQRGDEHRDPQAQPGGARRGVGEHLQRRDPRRRPTICSIVQPPSKPSSSARAR